MENKLENKLMKTGTTTIGLVCKDGIVLAADMRVTMGNIVGNKRFDKVYKITDNLALTTAGTVSDVQLLMKLIKAQLSLNKMRTKKDASVKEAANLIGMLVYENIRKFSTIPGITGFLLGGRDHTGLYLYEIAPDGSVIKADDYVTDGSGMVMAVGVLDTLYKPGMSVDEGIRLAVKAINASIQRDTYTGEGINVWTITRSGVKKALTKELDTNITV